MALPRRPLREDVYEALLERLLDGTLQPTARVNEQALCTELGVSRTPLREALIRLEQDGFLRNDVARGFTVRPLSESEIRDSYPIIWALEGLAVRLSPAEVLHEAIPNLKQLLAEMETDAAQGVTRFEELDSKWHAQLRAACGNTKIQELLEMLRRLIRRYEFGYKRDPARRRASLRQHEQIVNALDRRDIDEAVRLVEAHWRHGMEEDLAQLVKGNPSHRTPA